MKATGRLCVGCWLATQVSKVSKKKISRRIFFRIWRILRILADFGGQYGCGPEMWAGAVTSTGTGDAPAVGSRWDWERAPRNDGRQDFTWRTIFDRRCGFGLIRRSAPFLIGCLSRWRVCVLWSWGGFQPSTAAEKRCVCGGVVCMCVNVGTCGLGTSFCFPAHHTHRSACPGALHGRPWATLATSAILPQLPRLASAAECRQVFSAF